MTRILLTTPLILLLACAEKDYARCDFIDICRDGDAFQCNDDLFYAVHPEHGLQYVAETEEEIPEELEDILEAPKPDRELVPTVDNIFGNSNYVTNNEGKLSDPDNETYESQFNKIVEKDSFYEQEHLFVDKMSLRNFYKVPNTNDADSRKKFMEWCYKTEGKKN